MLRPMFLNASFKAVPSAERLTITGPIPSPTNGTHVVVLLTENGATSVRLGYNSTENGFSVDIGETETLRVGTFPEGAHLAAFPTDRPRTIESEQQDGGSDFWAASFYKANETMRMRYPEDSLEIQVSFLGIWPRENLTVARH